MWLIYGLCGGIILYLIIIGEGIYFEECEFIEVIFFEVNVFMILGSKVLLCGVILIVM